MKGGKMFSHNVKLEVIATYDKSKQEIFTLQKLPIKVLNNHKALVNYLKAMCNKDLLKLSLYWTCSEYMIKKYKTIEESINKYNGKYYFLVDIKV
jgi:hypothetical protein